ncbi:MAG: S-layer homology domain-containing protein [Actinobacteria bacterium]|nr:S-layer homology domain-containing protein [Actinomycetota bacterium]
MRVIHGVAAFSLSLLAALALGGLSGCAQTTTATVSMPRTMTSSSPVSQTVLTTSLAWSSLQITHNWTKNEQPQLDTRHLVWQAWDGFDWEIESEDLSTGVITQLTDDQLDQTDPRLTGDRVVWATHVLPGPDIPASYIVRNPVPQLTVYDYRDGKTTTIPGSVGAREVEVTGDLVSWVAGDGDRAEVYVHDLATGETKRLTNDHVQQSQVATDGRWVVYVTRADGHDEVWADDVQSDEHRQVSEPGATGTVEDLALNAGRAAWVEHDGARYRLLFVDLATNQHRELAREGSGDASGQSGSASGPAATQGQPPLLMDPVIGGAKLAYLRFTNPGRPVMPHESPWSVVLLDLKTQGQTVREGSDGGLWMQADGALFAYTAFEDRFGAGLHLYDTQTGLDSTPNPDPEGLSSGGPVGSPSMGGRGLTLGRSGGSLIGPSLVDGRVAFAVYQSVNAQYDDSDVILAYRGTAPPQPTAPSPPLRVFVDVAASPYAEAVNLLAGKGIVRGYQEGESLLFRPESPVFRWQFLRMVMDVTGVRWFMYNNQSPFTDTFVNGVEVDTLRRVAEAGLELRITKGTSPTRLSPYQPISRAEAVTMLIRAAEVQKPGSTTAPTAYAGSLGSFSAAHADTMRRAEYHHLLDGLVGFGPAWDPWQPMSRGEAAQVLANLSRWGAQ